MKKLLSIIFVISVLITSYSCEDNFNPYGDFKDRYVLNCIIRGDTTFQSATLTKDYVVDGFNPFSNTTDESVKGATVRIWSGNDKVAIMRDTTIARPEGDSYKTPYTVFYTNNFQPDASVPLTIEALLPNGKRLTCSTTAPAPLSMVFGNSDKAIPSNGKDYVRFAWSTTQKDPVFITRLAIYYFKHEGGQKTRNVAVVPANYVQYDNTWVPNYPKPTSEMGYSVDMKTISKAMELISAGDPNKSNYEILACILEVLSLDPGLSMYYNSTARSRDIYSVKLDETDFTNINGGFGVFGIYMRTYWVSFLDHAYIQSFGYVPGLKE
ncbi:MAG: DUF4249 domain-containing protein [Bacteroidetes bacterium]|nr:DUF4249 domain-containing protein [Bacteroidota bacterium]